MRCFISSQCSAQPRIADSVRELKTLGYRRIELTGGTSWYESLEVDVSRLETDREAEFMVHNYFPPQQNEFVLNLAVNDLTRRRALFAFIRSMAARAKRLGASVLGLHPGFRQDVHVNLVDGYFSPGDASAASDGAFWDSLPILESISQESGVRVCLENLAPRDAQDRFSYICHRDEINELFRRVRSLGGVGVLIDLGHLNVASACLGFDRAASLEDIASQGEKVFQFHLSHNDGTRDAHEPNPEGCWQVDFVSKRRSCFGELPVVLEWSRSATQHVKEQYDRIAKVLEES